MSHPQKSELRAQLRERRRRIPPAERRRCEATAARLVNDLPGWESLTRVAVYLAADGEFDPAPIAALCREQGKTVFLPVIQPDNSLLFTPWTEGTVLRANRFGIPEPQEMDGRCRAELLEVIFLPLVGWHRDGGRLGMGGGFYDRSLEKVTATLAVGLGFREQEAPGLVTDPWDIRLDFVITGRELIPTGAGH